MIIACPACKTRYVVPDSTIGIDGRTVRCAKCRHSWFQEGAELVAPAAPPPAPPAPPPPAPPPPPPPAPNFYAPPEPAAPEAIAPEPALQEPADYAAPVDEAPPPVSEPRAVPTYDDTEAYDDSRSSFEYEPPFRPRRNWLKVSTYAAAVFAVLVFAAIGAVAWYGLPDWAPFSNQTFAEGQADLQLDFPPNRLERRTLPNGTEYFGANGKVTNIGKQRRSVPAILIVLRDAHDRIVYSWEVNPAKRQLNPGESVTINEMVLDVPRSAKVAEVGWKPG